MPISTSNKTRLSNCPSKIDQDFEYIYTSFKKVTTKIVITLLVEVQKKLTHTAMPAESSSVNSYKRKAALSPVQLVLLGAGQKNYYNNAEHNSHPIYRSSQSTVSVPEWEPYVFLG